METVSVVLSNVLLFFLIFGLSATVDIRNLRRQLNNKFAIGTGVAMQFVIMPFLGFLVVLSLQNYGLTQAMGITLLVVTSSPGGSYSNWFCSTFNADLALSVTMTSISSLLSAGLLPANLLLYTYLAYASNDGIVQSLDFKAIFITLAVVMAAIFSGLAAGYRYDTQSFHVNANRLGSVSGILLIVVSFFLSNDSSGNEKTSLWTHDWQFYLGVAAPCVIGIVIANIVARLCFRLSPPEVVTLSIECAYQNISIATSVAVTMFTGKERAQAVAVPLFYGIVEAVAIGFYCLWAWKMGWTKAPANENFCVIVSKTYEVDDTDGEEGEVEDQLGEMEDTERGDIAFSADKKYPNRCRLVSEDNTTCTCSSHTTTTTLPMTPATVITTSTTTTSNADTDALSDTITTSHSLEGKNLSQDFSAVMHG
ncbi:Ileal sodium/bile acid cotransporter [Seminavis robusta]|uniref:Ileal sodium/bile acid cotransporter n=1 Tax=Seminavis robusta TaxID=568900 RepID=A0A9N8DEY4_9STRA|nr:Ileal sodium/bile acid cotransporter [Seminavis robusta]|eukprot:Sro117_g057460.1 Ileal sodium/bile acid cotransporter (423) ;mRNA; r:86567-87958